MTLFEQATERYKSKQISFNELVSVALEGELKVYGIALDEDGPSIPIEEWLDDRYNSLSEIGEDVPEFVWAWFNQNQEFCITYFIEDLDEIGNLCQSVVRISFRNLVREVYLRTE